MRVLALLLVLLGTPALAGADFSSGSTYEQQVSSFELAQAPTKGQSQGGGNAKPTPSLSGGDYPGRYCCIHCRHNEIPCGGECLPAGKKAGTAAGGGGSSMCGKVAGCACPGKP
jgi:hypothetical protein